jgi:hypothetical protein
LADAQSRLEAAAQAAEQWNQDRRNVELDLAEREQILQAAELESGKRELQLIAMRTQLRKEQQQQERLRANQRNGRSEQTVATALPGSNSTESIARRNGQTAVAATADAETYLASHEFGRILDRAIDESRVISPEELHESS